MEVTDQLYAPAALPLGENPTVLIEDEAAWATESVWTLWSREKPLVPTGNWTPAL